MFKILYFFQNFIFFIFLKIFKIFKNLYIYIIIYIIIFLKILIILIILKSLYFFFFIPPYFFLGKNIVWFVSDQMGFQYVSCNISKQTCMQFVSHCSRFCHLVSWLLVACPLPRHSLANAERGLYRSLQIYPCGFWASGRMTCPLSWQPRYLRKEDSRRPPRVRKRGILAPHQQRLRPCRMGLLLGRQEKRLEFPQNPE